MTIAGVGGRERVIVRAYLIGMLSLLIVSALVLTRVDPGWGYGDWLINYEGGFVRRGLIGEILLVAGRALWISPIDLVALAGIACYTALFVCVLRLLRASSWRWWVVGLLVCPATLAFPVISRSSFRKEILYFALLAALIEWVRRGETERLRDPALSVCLALASGALILSHEPMAAYLPYAAGALFISSRSARRVFEILLFPAFLCALATLLALTHRGDAAIVTRICASVAASGVHSCGLAVAGLAQTKQQAARNVALFAEQYHYRRNYAVCVALALVPFAGGVWDLIHSPESRRALRALGGAAGVAVPLSFSLFRYGVDWGRWINIHLISMLLLLLLIDAQRPPKVGAAPPRRGRPAIFHWAAVALLLAYAVCWSLPGVKDKPLFGWLSLAHRLIHWNGSLTS